MSGETKAQIILELDDDGKTTVEMTGDAPDVLWLLEKARFSVYQEMARQGKK